MVTWGDPELSCCDRSTISFITGECVGSGPMRADAYFEGVLKGLISRKWQSFTQDQLNITFMEDAAAAAAESLQSCPTLCDPIDGSPPGSSVPGILQAGTLEWVAILFSNA